jgi:hypothetical protein
MKISGYRWLSLCLSGLLILALIGAKGCNPVANTKQIINDRDADGVLNWEDNCPDTPNPDQADLNADGVGDACKPPLEAFILPGDPIKIKESPELESDPDQFNYSNNITYVGPEGEPTPGKYEVRGTIIRTGYDEETGQSLADYDLYLIKAGDLAWLRAELTWNEVGGEADYDMALYGFWDDGYLHDTRELFNGCGSTANDTPENAQSELVYTPGYSCTIETIYGPKVYTPDTLNPNEPFVLVVMGYDGALLDYTLSLDLK